MILKRFCNDFDSVRPIEVSVSADNWPFYQLLVSVGQYVSVFLADTDIVIIPHFMAKSDGPVKIFSVFILTSLKSLSAHKRLLILKEISSKTFKKISNF